LSSIILSIVADQNQSRREAASVGGAADNWRRALRVKSLQKNKNFHAKTQRRRDFAKKDLHKVKLLMTWSLEDSAFSLRLCAFA
jgi:hypothetical protein